MSTDIIMIPPGGTTRLPSLRSYSIFTGVGILFTFLLQVLMVKTLLVDIVVLSFILLGVVCMLLLAMHSS